MTSLSFVCLGEPAPQGSMRGYVAGGRAIVTSDNKRLRPWRDTVTWAARDALDAHPERSSFPLLGPVELRLTCWMRRPKNRPRTLDVYPLVPPDLDKLIRAIGDSLTNAGVVRDDSQITDMVIRKRYAVGPELPKIYDPLIHENVPCAQVRVRAIEL